MTQQDAEGAVNLATAAIDELHTVAIEMTARAQRFLDGIAAGKLPQNPADVPRAHALLREHGPMVRNPLAMSPVILRADGMIDVEVGEG